jgi:hypothetical protein
VAGTLEFGFPEATGTGVEQVDTGVARGYQYPGKLCRIAGQARRA